MDCMALFPWIGWLRHHGIFRRIRFSATEHLKMYKDAQYVKLKYSILGLRFIQLPNGGLSIVSPKEKPGAFSKITKEEFSWNICKEDL